MPATFQGQRFAALLLTVLATAVALLGASTVVAPDADAASERKIDHAIRAAKNQIGDWYSYGAAGPKRFDCSGLTYYAFQKRAGVRMPRTSDAQYRRMRAISKKNMQKGDLMFFYGGGGIYHVGMFLGWKNGKRILLHAPSTGRKVNKDRVWTRQWKPATLRSRG